MTIVEVEAMVILINCKTPHYFLISYITIRMAEYGIFRIASYIDLFVHFKVTIEMAQ